MIIPKKNGNSIYHYSDKNVKLRQIETGRIYDDANDVIPSQYTYEETDIPIDVNIDDSEEQTDG